MSNRDRSINVLSSTTPTSNKQQLKLKFKLATFDDIDNRKRHEIKEMADEIKKLLSLRIDRYTVVAHVVLFNI